jgi:hypothetical protein
LLLAYARTDIFPYFFRKAASFVTPDANTADRLSAHR